MGDNNGNHLCMIGNSTTIVELINDQYAKIMAERALVSFKVGRLRGRNYGFVKRTSRELRTGFKNSEEFDGARPSE